MSEIKNQRSNNLSRVAQRLEDFSEEQLDAKYKIIEKKLFEFANFLESHLIFLYTPRHNEIPSLDIIKKALQIEKQVVLPVFTGAKNAFSLYKITDFYKDLIENENGFLEPDTERCKKIALNEIDIAIIPGLVFDDKGGRIGFGNGYYHRLIAKLPETCRKVSLAYEEQVVDQIQMESRKYTVDIIITDERTIYKI